MKKSVVFPCMLAFVLGVSGPVFCETAAEAETAAETAAGTEDSGDSQIASSSEMSEAVELDVEGLVPLLATEIADGSYEIGVDSSSSMFRIEHCLLTVRDYDMSAVLTMGGTGYLYLFMGTPEEAVKASEDAYIPFVENAAGEHTFTVPVAALDQPLSCAAFSKKKEKWYPRTLVFRSSSLPAEALPGRASVTAEALSLEDGSYTVEVSLSGGSGRASVDSPAEMTVKDGKAVAKIRWGSSHYDYMLVDGEKYLPVNTEGNSEFEIPVLWFDAPMPAVGDTTAMSKPHEIEYTLFFDSGTIREN